MGELRSALDSLAATPVTDLSDEALLDRIHELCVARDHVDGLLARSLEVADARNATVTVRGLGTAGWLMHECRLSPSDARRRVHVARRLACQPHLAAAFEAGDVGQAHAQVITTSLQRLPVELRDGAEKVLVEAALSLDPRTVGGLGLQYARRACADETSVAAEQRRYASRWLTLNTTFDGMGSLSGMLDPESTAALRAALGPLAEPAGREDERTSGQRMADALGELAGHALACAGLPDTGGEPAQVLVTIAFDALTDSIRGEWGRVGLDQLPISPETARRIGCDAQVIPALLGSKGEVLDIGRASRTFPVAIRRAARLRDGGCTFSGCAAPLDRCQLHHIRYWSLGGPTSLTNCTHLCRFHHWLIHNSAWTLRRDVDGQIVVTSPAGVDYRSPPQARAG